MLLLEDAGILVSQAELGSSEALSPIAATEGGGERTRTGYTFVLAGVWKKDVCVWRLPAPPFL